MCVYIYIRSDTNRIPPNKSTSIEKQDLRKQADLAFQRVFRSLHKN